MFSPSKYVDVCLVPQHVSDMYSTSNNTAAATGIAFSQQSSAATLLVDVLLSKILHALRCLRC